MLGDGELLRHSVDHRRYGDAQKTVPSISQPSATISAISLLLVHLKKRRFRGFLGGELAAANEAAGEAPTAGSADAA